MTNPFFETQSRSFSSERESLSIFRTRETFRELKNQKFAAILLRTQDIFTANRFVDLPNN